MIKAFFSVSFYQNMAPRVLLSNLSSPKNGSGFGYERRAGLMDFGPYVNNHIFVISGNHDESGPILNNSGVHVELDPELRWGLPFVLDWEWWSGILS